MQTSLTYFHDLSEIQDHQNLSKDFDDIMEAADLMNSPGGLDDIGESLPGNESYIDLGNINFE